MAEEKDARLFDTRVVERNIEKGLITREDYEAYLASLEDLTEKADSFEATFIEGVLVPDDGQA